MKITKNQLRRIIQEEIRAVLKEGGYTPRWDKDPDYIPSWKKPVDPLPDGTCPKGYVMDEKTGKCKSRDPHEGEEGILPEEKDTSFSDAGEEIEKKGTEGVFTAKAKRAGMSVQAYADKVLAKDSRASTKTKRQAAFARGAKTVADKRKNK